LTTRITAETRKALESAAAASGRSLSQEAERRLRESLTLDDGRLRRGHIRAVGTVAAWAADETETFTEKSWVTDQFTAEAMRSSVDRVLLHLTTQPKGEVTIPARLERMAAGHPGNEVYKSPAGLGSIVAIRILSLIESAPHPDSKGRFKVWPGNEDWDDPFNPKRFLHWRLYQDLGRDKDRRK
jgi:hypothetical protein